MTDRSEASHSLLEKIFKIGLNTGVGVLFYIVITRAGYFICAEPALTASCVQFNPNVIGWIVGGGYATITNVVQIFRKGKNNAATEVEIK